MVLLQVYDAFKELTKGRRVWHDKHGPGCRIISTYWYSQQSYRVPFLGLPAAFPALSVPYNGVTGTLHEMLRRASLAAGTVESVKLNDVRDKPFAIRCCCASRARVCTSLRRWLPRANAKETASARSATIVPLL